MSEKLPEEGAWFLVPLPGEHGLYVPGLLARYVPETGACLGYFFQAADFQAGLDPQGPGLSDLQPSDAQFVLRFADTGVLGGHWTILLRHTRWDRDQWTIPAFCFKEFFVEACWKLAYAGDLVSVTSRTMISAEECADLEQDRLWTPLAIEDRLHSSLITRR